jgi:hypothetical protein
MGIAVLLDVASSLRGVDIDNPARRGARGAQRRIGRVTSVLCPFLLALCACWTTGFTGADTTRPAAIDSVPQEPGGPWPNLPAGYSTLTEQSFNAPIEGVWSLIWNTAGLGGLDSDSSAPLSPGGVMRFTYPAGFGGGGSPGTVTTMLGGQRRLYIGSWWKGSDGWQGHGSHVNKIQFIFPTAGDVYMAAHGPPGGPYELRICLQLVNADRRDWLRPNASPGVVTMGEWHRIEWLVVYGTDGVPNGQMRWWLDGKLVGDYRDILFPAIALSEYKVSPTWGGIGGNKTQTDNFWYDHIIIARP